MTLVVLFTYGMRSALAGMYDRRILKLNECSDVFKYLDGPPAGISDFDRALAVGRLDFCKGSVDPHRLGDLSGDHNPDVRIAAILPLLINGREDLACQVFEREISSGTPFGFDTSTPFLGMGADRASHRFALLKASVMFQKLLLRYAQNSSVDKMLRLRMAVTLHQLGHRNVAHSVAKGILASDGNSVPVTSWAEQILRDLKPMDTWGHFRLSLIYHGPQDKPYYDLVLGVAKEEQRTTNPFHLTEQISRTQAKKLWEYLRKEESGIFVLKGAHGTYDNGPRYILEFQVERTDRPYEIDMGWDVGMLSRLDSLRGVTSGRAGLALDRLLERLSGHRHEWEGRRNGQNQ